MKRLDYINQPITTEEEAKKFFLLLNNDDLLFHPEDDPKDIVSVSPCPSEGGPDSYYRIFSDEEAEILSQRLEEVYKVMKDPCEYIGNIIN